MSTPIAFRVSLASLATLSLAPLASPAALAAGIVVDSAGRDVTVLKSFDTGLTVGTTRTSGASLKIDTSRCAVTGSDGPYDLLDCDAELAARVAELAPHMAYPLARGARLRAERDGGSSDYYCHLQEIQTVTDEAALGALEGIGFSFAGAILVTPAARLARVDTVSLKDGRRAAVHAFHAPMFCWAGSMSSSTNAVWQFKPFAQFAGLDGNTYRVWDAVTENYRLSYAATRGFDRSAELLAP